MSPVPLPGVAQRSGACQWSEVDCRAATRFQVSLDCACAQQYPAVLVCTRHLAPLIRELAGRGDSHQSRESLVVRPLGRLPGR